MTETSDPRQFDKFPYKSFGDQSYKRRYPGEVAKTGFMTSQRVYTSASSPTVNHDGYDSAGISQVFEPGDLWRNTTTNKRYSCSGNSKEAAVWVEIVNGWDERNILYVGKHGANDNDGSSINDAFLTFGAAVTAATALTPSSSNRITIFCVDAGDYNEDITVPSWVGVIALGAKITGNHVVTDNSLLQSFRLIADTGVAVTKSTGTGEANVECPRMVLSASAGGVVCTAGSVNYNGNSIALVDGFGLGNLSTGIMHANVNTIEVSGVGIGVGIASTGTLVFVGDNISDSGSGTGIFLASTGLVKAVMADLDCATAYNVSTAGSELCLICSCLSGAQINNGTLKYISTDSGGSISGNLGLSGFLTQSGIYGGVHVHDASAAQSIPTGASYTKITAFTDNSLSSNVTPDAANDKITITKPGVYHVDLSSSFASGTNNVTFFVSAFLNGVEQDQCHFTRKVSVASDVGAASFTGQIDVTTVPWDLDLRARHDDAGSVDFTISYANFNVKYIGET